MNELHTRRWSDGRHDGERASAMPDGSGYPVFVSVQDATGYTFFPLALVVSPKAGMGHLDAEALASRIVAALNFCRGLTNDELEADRP